MSGLVAYGSSDEEEELESQQVPKLDVKVCSIATLNIPEDRRLTV